MKLVQDESGWQKTTDGPLLQTMANPVSAVWQTQVCKIRHKMLETLKYLLKEQIAFQQCVSFNHHQKTYNIFKWPLKFLHGQCIFNAYFNYNFFTYKDKRLHNIQTHIYMCVLSDVAQIRKNMHSLFVNIRTKP